MSFSAPALVLAMVIGAGAAEKALEKRVSVAFDGAPFIECLRALKEKAGVTFAVESELPEGALKRPITLELKDARAREVLKGLVNQVGAGFAVKRGVVLVTCPDAAHYESLVFRRYDVRSLTKLIRDFPGPGGPPWTPQDCSSIVITTIDEPEAITASSIAEEIVARVDPDSWEQEPGASIEERGGCLIVWQTPEAHAKIEKLLTEFTSRVKRMVEVEVVLLRLDAAPKVPIARLVDDGTAAELINKAEIVSRASTVCFVDQRQEIFAAEIVRFVAEMKMAKDMYDPGVRYLCHGLSVKIRPICAEGRDTVSLDLEIHWAHLNVFREKKVGKGELGVVRVQEPDVRQKMLHTTVCVRKGWWAALELAGERGVVALVRACPLEVR